MSPFSFNDKRSQKPNLINSCTTTKSKVSVATPMPNKRQQNYVTKTSLLNARSLKNKTEQIIDYQAEHNLDIMFFTECWLNDTDPEFGELTSGDHRLILKSRQGRPGGGVGCLHRSNIPVKQLDSNNTSTFEHLVLDINAKVIVLLVYRPEPSQRNHYNLSDFFDEFSDLISQIQGNKKPLLIIGDFNFHLNSTKDVNARKFNEVLSMFNLTQHVKGPTHVAGNTLDLVITRQNCQIVQSCITDELISDHCSILVNLNLSSPGKMHKRIKFRKTRNIKFDKFKIDVKHFFSHKLENLKLDTNNKTLLDNLISIYEGSNEVLDKHAPEKAKTIILRKPTPWNLEDIKPFKAAKRKAEKKWRKTRLVSDLETFKDRRNELNNHLKDLKRKDLAKKINDNRGNSKALFKIVNNVLHRNQDLPLPPNKDDEVLASDFSNFFDTKISKIRETLDSNSTNNSCHDVSQTSNTYNGQPLRNFKIMSASEIKKIISNMAPKHSKLDPMPTWIIKEHIEEFLPIITQIVNKSLQSGLMPTSLKHAIIKPLLKKANLEPTLKNYRPVSNLKFLGKVIEGAVIQQYIEHLNDNNLHDSKQSAYKPFHSTETLLTKIHNDIMLNSHKGEVTMLVLLDLSAAFDTIDHNILLNRLEKLHGIRGTALKWFKSYLSDRTQSVVIGEAESAAKILKYGVPQGSKLGPILFNSYISPLSEIAKKHKIDDQKYADDEQLILSFKPYHNSTVEAKHKMEKCITDIRTFLHKNKLCNNGEKTELIIIGQKNNIMNLDSLNSLNIDNVEITIADHVKNLGVIFDKHMKMEKQITKMCQSVYFNIRNISRIRNSMNYDDTKTVVNALVTPHLDYGNGLLFGISGRSINKLQVAQNSAVRLIERMKKHDHISEKRKNLHWLPIKARIEYKLMTLTWKVINNQAPKYLIDLIQLRKDTRQLRSSDTNLLKVPELTIKNKWGDRAFSVSSPVLWNRQPAELRHLQLLRST